MMEKNKTKHYEKDVEEEGRIKLSFLLLQLTDFYLFSKVEGRSKV